MEAHPRNEGDRGQPPGPWHVHQTQHLMDTQGPTGHTRTHMLTQKGAGRRRTWEAQQARGGRGEGRGVSPMHTRRGEAGAGGVRHMHTREGCGGARVRGATHHAPPPSPRPALRRLTFRVTSPGCLPTLAMLRVRAVPTSATRLASNSLNCQEKVWVMVRLTRAHTSCTAAHGSAHTPGGSAGSAWADTQARTRARVTGAARGYPGPPQRTHKRAHSLARPTRARESVVQGDWAGPHRVAKAVGPGSRQQAGATRAATASTRRRGARGRGADGGAGVTCHPPPSPCARRARPGTRP